VRAIAQCLAAAALAAAATGCIPSGEAGFVEIKVLPASASPALYLDTVRLQPLKSGGALIRQQVGTMKLQTDSLGGQLSYLCDLVVKKNRITTVTVRDRPFRCECKNGGARDASSPQVCLS
jgi:hypothetical protein